MSSIYYIYAYLRNDGSPYYIGKGKDDRAYIKTKKDTIKPPTDKSKIVFMERNLTEIGAFALERKYIKWYGRKDLQTGILRNKTDGGEGSSGLIWSEEQKLKKSNSVMDQKNPMYGKKHTKETIHNMKKPKSIETKTKISISRKGILFSQQHKQNLSLANMGKKQSIETKQKRSDSQIGIQKPKLECEICHKLIGGPGNMKLHMTRHSLELNPAT
jgi:hypothetical protein